MAGSTVQARSLMNVTRAIFEENVRFRALVSSIGADTITLKNRVDIAIRPANWRTIRGITAAAVIAEEISTWQDAELGSKNPDREILNAARPSLATTGGLLISIGSPLTKSGEAWKTFRRHFGPHGSPDVIVANGPTSAFNPTVPQSIIDNALVEDPELARSEWLGEFRDARSAFVPAEAVEACVERGTLERPHIPGKQYLAHVDASGGGSDSFALSIGHLENGIGIVDCIREYRPPLSPKGVIAEMCDVLRGYKVHHVSGDHYSGEFVREQFRKRHIDYRLKDELNDKRTASSEYFLAFLPIMNSKRCILLDNKRLISQLSSLERRPSRTGARDTVGHPSGGHDDVAVVVAALMARLLGKREPIKVGDAALTRFKRAPQWGPHGRQSPDPRAVDLYQLYGGRQ